MANQSNIEHKGRIIEISDSFIKVQILAEAACASCHAKSLCGVSDRKEKIIEIKNTNNFSYETGEEVVVQMKSELGYFALFLGYILPFIVLIIALSVFTSILSNQALAALLALTALIPYYTVLYFFRNKLQRKFTFSIK